MQYERRQGSTPVSLHFLTLLTKPNNVLFPTTMHRRVFLFCLAFVRRDQRASTAAWEGILAIIVATKDWVRELIGRGSLRIAGAVALGLRRPGERLASGEGAVLGTPRVERQRERERRAEGQKDRGREIGGRVRESE